MWHALLYYSIITCFTGVASADIAQNEISFQDYKVVSTTIGLIMCLRPNNAVHSLLH